MIFGIKLQPMRPCFCNRDGYLIGNAILVIQTNPQRLHARLQVCRRQDNLGIVVDDHRVSTPVQRPLNPEVRGWRSAIRVELEAVVTAVAHAIHSISVNPVQSRIGWCQEGLLVGAHLPLIHPERDRFNSSGGIPRVEPDAGLVGNVHHSVVLEDSGFRHNLQIRRGCIVIEGCGVSCFCVVDTIPGIKLQRVLTGRHRVGTKRTLITLQRPIVQLIEQFLDPGSGIFSF